MFTRAFRAAPGLFLCALVLLGAAGAPLAVRAGSSAGGGSDTGGDTSAPVPEGQGLYAPADFAPQAQAVCMVNEETGIVAYEKNADAPLTAASCVKMMTCILAAERIDDWDGTLIAADKTWIYDLLAEYREQTGGTPSHADIRRGETLSARELLYAMLLPSANEAALMVADYVCGGYMPNFIYMMNARAAALGCTGTVFADANGLSEENVTTARDMVLIARAFMKVPVLAEAAAAVTFEMPAHEKHASAYTIHATNRLLVKTSPYYSAFAGAAGTVLAGKTGSLGEWQNFVSMARRDGESYILAVLHSPNAADAVGAGMDPAQYRPALYESAQLYEWAFDTLAVSPAIDTSRPVTELRVRYSSEQYTVRLMPGGDIKALLPRGGDSSLIKYRYDLPEWVEAPVKAGQELGSVTLLAAGKEIGTVGLLAETDIERNQTLYAVQTAGGFFTSVYFRVLVVLVLLAGGGYAALVYYAHRRRAARPARQGAAADKKMAPPAAARRAPADGGKQTPAPARAKTVRKRGGTDGV